MHHLWVRFSGFLLAVAVLAISGCSSTPPSEDRPSAQFALAVNLNDAFAGLYPKVYINNQLVFRDKLLLAAQTHQVKLQYRNRQGQTLTQVMDVNFQANRCYFLAYRDQQFQFNIQTYQADYCSALIDRTRYEAVGFKRS